MSKLRLTLGCRNNDRTRAPAFLRYHHEQGLSARLLTPDELFAPEALESFKIRGRT